MPDPTRRPAVGLATSNGTGMGHLAREIPVALTLAEQADPLVFSLSSALPIISEHGLRGEYCASYQAGWMPQDRWHAYLRERIGAIAAEAGLRVLVFDGVAPYRGLLQARADLPDTAFVWARRGLWRPGANLGALRATPFFDLVIEPGDLAGEADRGATARLDNAVRVPPVTLLEHVEPLPRKDAAVALGLDPDRPSALVALGGGVINDVATPGTAALTALLADDDWQVAVTRTAITRGGIPVGDPARTVELREVYPLARYLRAFDAAVAAAGYNSFHELLYAGVPTLLVPNRSAATDDQVARARWAVGKGLALCADESEPGQIATQAARLHDPGLRAELAAACAELPRPTGSRVAAARLVGLTTGWDGPPTGPGVRLRAADLAVRDVAMRALGRRGTAAVRRALGRRRASGPARPLNARLVEERPGEPVDEMASRDLDGRTTVVMTERLEADLLRAGHPVEHLLAGSSESYREQRRAIAHRYYELSG